MPDAQQRLTSGPNPAPVRASRRNGTPALWCVLGIVALLVAGCGESSTSSGPEPVLCGNGLSSGAVATGPTPVVGVRPLPAWYADAKLGIMIHWGVWAVPGWAETTLDPERLADPHDPLYLFAPGGLENFVRHNPYSEWYENSLAIAGAGTQEFHRSTYGAGFPYTGFQPLFEEQARAWNPEAWARLFADAGARYVVLVTKHHDGYALWPTAVANPHRPGWNWQRDAVGELTAAVRARCMRMGLYYSGGIDWSFKAPPLATLADFVRSVPAGPEYARYFDEHYRELIARYQPSVLWNDINAPTAADLDALFRDYYAAVPDGVVNDRWSLDPTAVTPDFRTFEYTVPEQTVADKWEAVRGIGRTFGYNRNERPEDYGTPEMYIHLWIDVVSKNGNLLLNVGPRADGTIPEAQVRVLRALGAWGALYGEAIFATRPWTRNAGSTDQGIAVRFTQRRDAPVTYALLLGTPSGPTVTLQDFPETPVSVRLVGSGTPLAWEQAQGGLRIALPSALPAQPAHAFAITFAAS